MSLGKRLLWGGLGWALGGPIGGIIGFALASMREQRDYDGTSNFSSGFRSMDSNHYTRPGDFAVSLLVLFAVVMKADRQLLKSELNYIKQFLLKQFKSRDVNDLMILFRDILDQDYHLRDVCRQIQRSMDHPSRLELVHVLFGLSLADGNIHEREIDIIATIARYLNINEHDFQSIKAMFVCDRNAAYKILEIDNAVSNDEVKRAYRRMANKYHPDKVTHLGPEVQKKAEEKFKAVNEAFHSIKQERQMA